MGIEIADEYPLNGWSLEEIVASNNILNNMIAIARIIDDSELREITAGLIAGLFDFCRSCLDNEVESNILYTMLHSEVSYMCLF